MDDPRTTQALRELAAMYLSPPVEGGDDAAAREAGGSNGAAGGRAGGDGDGGGVGPAASPDVGPIDAELLVLGHLPGPANLWANQYAQRRAQQLGREVALARIGEDHLALDWFPLDPSAASVGDGPLAADLDHVGDAIDALRRRHCLWIVAFAEPIREEALALLGRLERWALLSGADEAAVVAAYQLLKRWLDVYRRANGGAREPRVALAMLGCDGETAAAAVEKVRRAAGRFLAVAPEPGLHQQRMEPVHRRAVGRFELDDAALRALADLAPLQPEPSSAPRLHLAGDAPPDEPTNDKADAPTAEASPSADHDAPAAGPRGGPVDDDLARRAMLEQLLGDRPEPGPRAAPTAAPDAHGAGARTEPAVDEDVCVEPEPEPDASPASSGGPGEEGGNAMALTDYLPQLEPLRARCPYDEAVEFAVDGDGTLHLLLDAAAVGDPVRVLWQTRHWAVEHAKLIALTTVDASVEVARPPELHLFTDAPKRYISLAQRNLLHLHALTPNPADPAAPPLHVELN